MEEDEWGFMTVKEKLKELGYCMEKINLFAVIGEGLIPIHDDQDCLDLLDFEKRPREIELWNVNVGMGECSVIDYETEALDVEGDCFVDATVGYVGEQIGSIDRENDVEVQLSKLDCELEYSDDGSLVESDSEFEDDAEILMRSKNEALDVHFSLRQEFESKAKFKEHIEKYAFKNGKDLEIKKNDKERMVVKCRDKKDEEGKVVSTRPWSITLRNVVDEGSWNVTVFDDNHENCGWTYNNQMVKARKIAMRWKNDIRGHSNWQMKEFSKKVSSDESFHVGPRQAYRAMNIAKQAIQGEHDENFAKLWSYRDEIQKCNPKTTLRVKLSEDEENGRRRFKRIYIYWDTCKEGFKNSMPIIGVDGCHIKTTVGVQILGVVTVDSSDSIFPLAYAIVEGENKSSWCWFLELLRDDLDISEEKHGFMTFISDKQKGLVNAFEELFPRSSHRFCVRHLHANMKVAGFNGLEMKNALWTAARATIKNGFYAAKEVMKGLDAKVEKWLDDKHPAEWSRSHFNCFAQSDMLVNNIFEVFNVVILEAREAPLIACLETIKKQIMVKLYACRVNAEKWNAAICPTIQKKLAKMEKFAAGCISDQFDTFLFEVRGSFGGQHQVDLLNRSCSCRKWDLTGIPCPHAISSIWQKKGKVSDYVSHYYSTNTYMKIYANSIHPLAGPEEWPPSTRIPPLPPIYNARPGRPKKLRKISADEVISKDGVNQSRRFVKLHCSKCKNSGHYAKTYPTNPPKATDSPNQTPMDTLNVDTLMDNTLSTPSMQTTRVPLPSQQLSQIPAGDAPTPKPSILPSPRKPFQNARQYRMPTAKFHTPRRSNGLPI